MLLHTPIINNFNHIKEFYVWAVFSEDTVNENIRGSIRSRGPIINEVAANYNGGGHIYASGVRLTEEKDIENLVKELDNECLKYRENNM